MMLRTLVVSSTLKKKSFFYCELKKFLIADKLFEHPVVLKIMNVFIKKFCFMQILFKIVLRKINANQLSVFQSVKFMMIYYITTS